MSLNAFELLMLIEIEPPVVEVSSLLGKAAGAPALLPDAAS